MSNTSKLNVCIGSWAGAKIDVLRRHGIELAPDTDGKPKWPTREMTLEEMLSFARVLLQEGDVGVMIRPASSVSSLDYIVWVDSAAGRFLTR